MPVQPEFLGGLSTAEIARAFLVPEQTMAQRLVRAESRSAMRRSRTASRTRSISRPGPYQIQAAINAVNTDATGAADTDWRQIVELYDQPLILTPTPVVALNRAVAVAEVDGPVVPLTHAYEKAMALTLNGPERDLLRRRHQALTEA